MNTFSIICILCSGRKGGWIEVVDDAIDTIQEEYDFTSRRKMYEKAAELCMEYGCNNYEIRKTVFVVNVKECLEAVELEREDAIYK